MADFSLPPDYPPGHDLLRGQRVLITAAAGTGIGFAAAKRCVEEGASVLISDIHPARLTEAAARLGALARGRVVAQRGDVTVQEDVDALFAAAEQAFGAVDVVINNAGLGGTANLVDMTDGQVLIFHDIFGINAGRKRKHVRKYADVGDAIIDGTRRFIADVQSGSFPGDEESFSDDGRSRS